MKRPHFGGISIFLRFRAFWGSGHLCFFWGWQSGPKIQKNRIWGPVEAVSAKFFGDLKVAHGDSATDEPKKSRFWAAQPELCRKYRFMRPPAVGPMGARGQKDLEKKRWNLTENHQKRKKSNLPSKCAEFRQECRDNFFFRIWTRFDPLLAILLVLGGWAYIGEPGQKDLEKIRKTT